MYLTTKPHPIDHTHRPDMKFLDSMVKCYNNMCQLLSHQESTYQGIHHLQVHVCTCT